MSESRFEQAIQGRDGEFHDAKSWARIGWNACAEEIARWFDKKGLNILAAEIRSQFGAERGRE